MQWCFSFLVKNIARKRHESILRAKKNRQKVKEYSTECKIKRWWSVFCIYGEAYGSLKSITRSNTFQWLEPRQLNPGFNWLQNHYSTMFATLFLVFICSFFISILCCTNDSLLSSASVTICSNKHSAWLPNSNTRSSKTRILLKSTGNDLIFLWLGFVEDDADAEWQESWIEKTKGKVQVWKYANK